MKSRAPVLIAPILALAAWLLTQPELGAAGSPSLRFTPGENSEFTFDTGVLRGKLRAGGKSAGLSGVVHVPTGTRLDASMGLLSHYRLFTQSRRYGTAAWDLPSEARLAADGSVEVRWRSAPDRPFELRAIYRWADPASIDLETTVHAVSDLVKFESFLASYFAPPFTNSVVCVNEAAESSQYRFMPAERTAGVWLAFPRDDAARACLEDGRWKIEPNPVDWVIMPHLARALGFRRSPADGLTAVLMSPAEDCFAILTPFQAEPHYSMYLSLFGRDLKAGETVRTRTRLMITDRISESDMVRTHTSYVNAAVRL